MTNPNPNPEPLSDAALAPDTILFTEDNAEVVQAFIGGAGEAHNGPSFVKLAAYAVPGDTILNLAGRLYIVPPHIADAVAESQWRGARIDELSGQVFRVEKAAERHRDHAVEMSHALTDANRAVEQIAAQRDDALSRLRLAEALLAETPVCDCMDEEEDEVRAAEEDTRGS